MPTIRCAACGKHYDYHREGCCPRCGAYNRPPRREWGEADGSVHHGTPSEKVCYEKKVCFEEQTRKPRKKPSAPQAASTSPKPSQVRYSKGNPRNNSLAFVIIVIVFLLIFALAKGVCCIKPSGIMNSGRPTTGLTSTGMIVTGTIATGPTPTGIRSPPHRLSITGTSRPTAATSSTSATTWPSKF